MPRIILLESGTHYTGYDSYYDYLKFATNIDPKWREVTQEELEALKKYSGLIVLEDVTHSDKFDSTLKNCMSRAEHERLVEQAREEKRRKENEKRKAQKARAEQLKREQAEKEKLHAAEKEKEQLLALAKKHGVIVLSEEEAAAVKTPVLINFG